MARRISIIVPTYNERENVAELVRRIDDSLAGYDYEVIFVDDNSPDETAREARNLSGRYPVSVIVREGPRGLATAVVEGFRHSEGDLVGVIDGDLQHPPEVLVELIDAVSNGADLAIASRYEPGAGEPALTPARRMGSRLAVSLAHLIVPATHDVTDPMSGCFVMKRGVVKTCDLKPVGFKILLEVLALGTYGKVRQLPVTLNPRHAGRTKMGTREYVLYLAHLVSLLFRSGEPLRFVKYCVVGLSGVVVNMGLLWLLTEQAGLNYLLSACIGIETAIISNGLLNDRFTFRDRRDPGIKALILRLLKFNGVSAVGVAINLGTLWLLTAVAGLYYIASNAIGIVAATLWNYLVNRRWTWRSERSGRAKDTELEQRDC